MDEWAPEFQIGQGPAGLTTDRQPSDHNAPFTAMRVPQCRAPKLTFAEASRPTDWSAATVQSELQVKVSRFGTEFVSSGGNAVSTSINGLGQEVVTSGRTTSFTRDFKGLIDVDGGTTVDAVVIGGGRPGVEIALRDAGRTGQGFVACSPHQIDSKTATRGIDRMQAVTRPSRRVHVAGPIRFCGDENLQVRSSRTS
jgi:hypothetical protein